MNIITTNNKDIITKNKDTIYVFISHSHKDIKKVRIVRNYLESLNSEPILFFLKSLSDKDEITKLIKDEIDARIWFIYCKSKNAEKSKWVKTELDYVKQTNKENFLVIDLDKDFNGLSLNDDTIDKINQAFTNISYLTTFFVSSETRNNKFVKNIIKTLKKYNIRIHLANDLIESNDFSNKISNNLNKRQICLSFMDKDWEKYNCDTRYRETRNMKVIPVVLDNEKEGFDINKSCMYVNTDNPEDAAFSIINTINNCMGDYEYYFIKKLNLIIPKKSRIIYENNRCFCFDACDMEENIYELKILRKTIYDTISNRVIKLNPLITKYVDYLILICCQSIFDVHYVYKIPSYIIPRIINIEKNFTITINNKTEELLKKMAFEGIITDITDEL